jgi:hypothetical protein
VQIFGKNKTKQTIGNPNNENKNGKVEVFGIELVINEQILKRQVTRQTHSSPFCMNGNKFKFISWLHLGT